MFQLDGNDDWRRPPFSKRTTQKTRGLDLPGCDRRECGLYGVDVTSGNIYCPNDVFFPRFSPVFSLILAVINYRCVQWLKLNIKFFECRIMIITIIIYLIMAFHRIFCASFNICSVNLVHRGKNIIGVYFFTVIWHRVFLTWYNLISEIGLELRY